MSTLKEIRQAAERAHIVEVLLAHPARKEAASVLGISRKSLWEKMRRYGIVAETRTEPQAEVSP